MLELRLTVDAKRLASMREAVTQECLRANVDTAHAHRVAFLAELLIDHGASREARHGRRRLRARRPEALVIVTVQSDATMLMVRETTPRPTDLGPLREQLLEAFTARWSTMAGLDGRTIWAEVTRAAGPAVEPSTASPASPASASVPGAPALSVRPGADAARRLGSRSAAVRVAAAAGD